MSDEKALLAAIWEHPHDDTVRLVYADWLQENGQPERAEFIRVQIELSRVDEWDDSPRTAELKKREKQLWTKHAKTWKAGLSPLLQKLGGFVRGFPAPQPRAMPSSKFLKLTATDFEGAPLWDFHFPTNHKLLPKLLASPMLLRIGTLNFRFWLESPDDVRQFVASPNVRNLADLNVSMARIGNEGMRELGAGGQSLPNLRRLNLEYCHLTATGVELFADSPLAEQLEVLDLSSNPIGPGGIEALASSSRLGRLKRLDLSSYADGGKGAMLAAGKAIRRLCESPHLAALRVLILYSSGLDDANIEQMCQSRPAFRLVELSLIGQYPRLTNAGAESLAAWPALASVRRLNLRANEIGAAGALALARSPHLNQITELHVDVNPLCKDRAAVAELRARFGDAVRVT